MAGRGDQSPSGFGESLRRLRDEKGLTQKQLGDAAGVHPNTVAKLERGDQEPNWPVVLKFAEALGVECTAFKVAPAEPEPEGGGKPASRAKAAKKKPDKGKK